jgi:RsiW-degrading membrane proteinase PrsW (M82 family)
MDITLQAFVIAFGCGLIPSLFWLWFWLREDRLKPEPLLLIAITFVAGMAVVPLALPLQKMAIELYVGTNLIFVWVIIEETLKYLLAVGVIFWNKAVDEPIDMIIYMITIALGFACLENTLFLLSPLSTGDYLNSTLTGSFRFLGATLLHVLASGTVGVFLAFAFYKNKFKQIVFGMIGLFLAVILHGLFNFSIMDASGETILGVFLFVWIGIIVLFFLFEKVKQNERQHLVH